MSQTISIMNQTIFTEQLSFENPSDIFFDEIEGHGPVKDLCMRAIVAKEPVHVNLHGGPASGKSLFMLAMRKKLQGAYFADGGSTTAAGIINYVFQHKPRFLLIDEIDKMKKKDQSALLNMMETGILTETKKGNTRQEQVDVRVFATCNDIDKLTPELRSRFTELYLKSYTPQEFVRVAAHLLMKRYQLDLVVAAYIANVTIKELKGDMRDMLNIVKMTNRTIEDVDKYIATLKEYRKE